MSVLAQHTPPLPCLLGCRWVSCEGALSAVNLTKPKSAEGPEAASDDSTELCLHPSH